MDLQKNKELAHKISALPIRNPKYLIYITNKKYVLVGNNLDDFQDNLQDAVEGEFD